MLFAAKVLRQSTIVVGFTGTIASGKTARCHRLVQTAFNLQLRAAGASGSGAAAEPISAERALAMASVVPVSSSSSATNPAPQAALPLAVGVKYVNADLVGHNIYLPGKPCYHELIECFGEAILEKQGAPSPSTSSQQAGSGQPMVNRKALGALVFADKAKLQQLNAICWPHISAAIVDHLHEAEREAFTIRKQRCLVLVVEAALLLEMGSTLRLCSDVWLTHCRPDVAVARVQSRDKLSEEEARRRVASQAPLSAKQEVLAKKGFTEEKGNLELFDTSDITLEAGLQAVDERFDSMWRRRIEPLLLVR